MLGYIFVLAIVSPVCIMFAVSTAADGEQTIAFDSPNAAHAVGALCSAMKLKAPVLNGGMPQGIALDMPLFGTMPRSFLAAHTAQKLGW